MEFAFSDNVPAVGTYESVLRYRLDRGQGATDELAAYSS